MIMYQAHNKENRFETARLSITSPDISRLVSPKVELGLPCYNIMKINILLNLSRDSVVGIATVYGLNDRGVAVRIPVGSRIFFSPLRPDQLWGPPNFLSNGYRG
jgi:hypothetical protein